MLHACLCTICFVFCYTSWHFYAFPETNILMRCHSASSMFCAVFVFQKSYTGNILRIGRNKSQSSYFSRYETESKAETEGGQRAATPPTARASPWPCRGMVWAPGPPPNIALPPIYSPQRENPKDLINFPENILQAATVVDARSGGSRSSSRHPTGEGNHHRRPTSSPCMPPKWCVSSLTWTTCP
jgi:hypothetical protein